MLYILVPIMFLLILMSMATFGVLAGGLIACFGMGGLSLLLLHLSIRRSLRVPPEN